MAKLTEQQKIEKRNEKQYKKKHKGFYRITPGSVIFNIINYLFFGLFTLLCIFPFYYLFINTISLQKFVVTGDVLFFPRGFQLETYKSLLNVDDLGQALFISFTRTVVGTVLMVVTSGLAGYLVTKQEMWHRKFWYRFLVITMYFNAGMIPTYMNLNMLGLTNRFLVYILPGIVAPYNIILVKTYIESIPAEMEESAFIDGAGYFTIFRKIIWPLSKPILATIAIFGAVGHWNSFQDSLIYMQNSPELFTIQYRLYLYLTTNAGSLQSSMQTGSTAAFQETLAIKVIKYAVSMVTIIPILVVYPFMMRYFEEGIMLGAVKG